MCEKLVLEGGVVLGGCRKVWKLSCSPGHHSSVLLKLVYPTSQEVITTHRNISSYGCTLVLRRDYIAVSMV